MIGIIENTTTVGTWTDPNRTQKNASRNIIAMDAAGDPYPTVMVTLPGSEWVTEQIMHQKGVKFGAILAAEREESVIPDCEETLQKLPPAIKKKARLHRIDMKDLLEKISKENSTLINNYWLDTMGPINHETVHLLEIIAFSPTLKHAIDRYEKVRIQFVVQTHDRFICQDEILQDAFVRLNKQYKNLSPEPPAGKSRLQHFQYYQQTSSLHYYVSSIFNTRGFEVTNNHMVVYKDTSPMLFYSVDITYVGNKRLPEMKAPLEPALIGLVSMPTPHTDRWIEENSPKGVFLRSKVIATGRTTQMGTETEKPNKKSPKTKPAPRANKPQKEVGIKTGPAIFKIVQILANDTRLEQTALESKLIKAMPNENWTPKEKGCPPAKNTTAWAKVHLRMGGYAHEKPNKGVDNGIRLTQKGIKMARSLKTYSDDFISKIRKGAL